MALARAIKKWKNRGSITYGTDRANDVIGCLLYGSFQIEKNTTLNSHVDFYGERKPENPEKNLVA
jgi:hypothetical protein